MVMEDQTSPQMHSPHSCRYNMPASAVVLPGLHQRELSSLPFLTAPLESKNKLNKRAILRGEEAL